jgi:predicted DsbA family dithiol-disulfide isomerase
LQQEFDFVEEWLPFEIHPNTPPEGIATAVKFPGMNVAGMLASLNTRGEEMGIVFNDFSLLSNSRLSLEAGEFAKEQGRFHEYHEAIFRAYFTDAKNIGDRVIILEAAREAGLDTEALGAALDAGSYLPRLEEAKQSGHKLGISAAPTFVINTGGLQSEIIVGAQPLDILRQALQRAQTA